MRLARLNSGLLGNHRTGTTVLALVCLASAYLASPVASYGNDPNCGLKGTGPGLTGSKLGIRNGTAVRSPTQYPWMAHLLFQLTPTMGMFCGASILNSEWLLTAAHCVSDEDSNELLDPLESFLVGAGTINSIVRQAPHQRRVSLVIRHPRYRPAGSGVDEFVNDIALVKLDRPLDLSLPELGSVCLPRRQRWVDSLANRQMTLTGFGSTTNDLPGEVDRPKVLQQLTARVAPQSECWRLIVGEYTRAGFNREMCWGDAAHGECVGDSGGPLVARNGGRRWYQYGVVSFVDPVVPDRAGVGACRNSFLVRTSDYSEWIWRVIARN